MAKGVPILGKDPLGKAKYANVTESGDLRVQLSGTIELERNPGKNLFNKVTAKPSSFIGSVGQEVSASDALWHSSDFIRVLPGTNYKLSHVSNSATGGVAFYTEEKTFISWVSNNDIRNTNNVITTPPNTHFIRISIYNFQGALDFMQVEEGTVTTVYEPYRETSDIERIAKKISDFNGVPMTLDGLALSNYKKVADKEKYQVWEYNRTDWPIRALDRRAVVRVKNNNLTLRITDLIEQREYEVTLTSATFPGLLPNSAIEHVRIIPWTRNMGVSQDAQQWRLIVVTTGGQIYHNFPSRAVGSDGFAVDGDIVRFEESVVWDLPGRKYPSQDPGATGVERYYPGLPANLYTYHPIPNDSAEFVDTYGNGGFGKSITHGGTTYARFYEPRRGASRKHSFGVMGSFEIDSKVTLLGTYRNNGPNGDGSRICLFATSDGGRSWYCKYEWASNNGVTNWANSINTSGMASAYTEAAFVVKKRSLNLPSNLNKEPDNLFSWGPDIVVSNISRTNPAIVTTATPHGLVSGDVIVFQKNSGSGATSPDWDWLRNDTVSDSSGGNGLMFKVDRINDTSFRLYDYIHATDNNLPCRHVHHINRVKDGWVIGTGETYPEGWIHYMQMREADSFSLKRAYDSFNIYRLNSTNTSVQRTLGALLLDDKENTFVAAVDESMLSRPNVVAPEGRTIAFSRSSTGVFAGRLSEIDNLHEYEVLFDAKEPAYYFKEHFGAWIFIGQRGECGISFDAGKTWMREQLRTRGEHLWGENENLIAISDFVFVLK